MIAGEQLIGWGASLVLFATIVQQIWRQWHAETTKGVSSLLFVGQFVASAGFLLYSYLTHDAVFMVTNGALAVAAVVGYVLLRIRRREEGAAGAG